MSSGKRQVFIERSGRLESQGRESSSDDSADDLSSSGRHGFESTGSSSRLPSATARSSGRSDEGSGDGRFTRALLNEATKRPDRKTMLLVEKSIEKYSFQRRFTYFSDRTDVLQGDTLFTIGQEQQQQQQPEQLERLKEEPFFWIDVNGWTDTDLSHIATNFAVHPLTIEDIQMQDSREKCEVFEHYIFICIRTLDEHHLDPATDVPHLHKASLAYAGSSPVNVYMIIFQTHILTLHSSPIMNIRSVLKRVFPLRSQFELTADWLGYALIDDIVDEFMPNLRKIEFEVDTIDDLVLVLSQSDQAELLRRIGRARKRVTLLMRLLKPKTDILKALAKRCPERLKSHTLLYIRDIQDHLFTMVQNLEHYSETLNRSHNNYLAQISIELNAASNRMDSVVKKLTGAAFFMLPLSLISSIWGMNIPVPGDGNFTSNYVPFFAIITMMGAVVLIMYALARKYEWL